MQRCQSALEISTHVIRRSSWNFLHIYHLERVVSNFTKFFHDWRRGWGDRVLGVVWEDTEVGASLGCSRWLCSSGLPMRNAIDIHGVDHIVRLWSYRVHHKDKCERSKGAERGWAYLTGALCLPPWSSCLVVSCPCLPCSNSLRMIVVRSQSDSRWANDGRWGLSCVADWAQHRGLWPRCTLIPLRYFPIELSKTNCTIVFSIVILV
jgi:hypothetical protein